VLCLKIGEILFLLLFAPATHAEEIPAGTVEVNSKVYKPENFRKHKNITVKPLAKPLPHPDALPRKAHREEVFARVAGLAPYVEKWDELDRDLLYMRARNNTLAEMQEKTPNIPASILQQLKAEATKP
jgi:hypothetical protein